MQISTKCFEYNYSEIKSELIGEFTEYLLQFQAWEIRNFLMTLHLLGKIFLLFLAKFSL